MTTEHDPVFSIKDIGHQEELSPSARCLLPSAYFFTAPAC
jgi:hypothetical protein